MVSGDTLTKVATRFNTSVKALRSLNGLKTDNIRVGHPDCNSVSYVLVVKDRFLDLNADPALFAAIAIACAMTTCGIVMICQAYLIAESEPTANPLAIIVLTTKFS